MNRNAEDVLPLDSHLWPRLRTAFGPATEIPALLGTLRSERPLDRTSRAPSLAKLWEHVCHQGVPDEAAYAVVPHLVQQLAALPTDEGNAVAHLVGNIVANRERGAELSTELQPPFTKAVERAREPILVRLRAATDDSVPDLASDLAAVTGHLRLGRVLSRWSSAEVECRCARCGARIVLGTTPSGVDASPNPWVDQPRPVALAPGLDPLEALVESDEPAAAKRLAALALPWAPAVAAAAGTIRCSCGAGIRILPGVDSVY